MSSLSVKGIEKNFLDSPLAFARLSRVNAKWREACETLEVAAASFNDPALWRGGKRRQNPALRRGGKEQAQPSRNQGERGALTIEDFAGPQWRTRS